MLKHQPTLPSNRSMTLKVGRQLCLYTVCFLALVVLCAPAPSESRRVIFHAPASIFTGQILATHGKEKPCPQCQMRDHRGYCRRIISFNADGVKC